MRGGSTGWQSYAQAQAKKRIEPPRPVQLGSLKSENEGQDPGIRLVPAGGGGWGRRKEEDVEEETKKEEPEEIEKPKEPAPKPKLGNLTSQPSSLRPSGWATRSTPWSSVAAAPPMAVRAQPSASAGRTASRRQEDEFPSLGSEAAREPARKRSWADEDIEIEARPARLTDLPTAGSLRPTVAPPSESQRKVAPSTPVRNAGLPVGAPPPRTLATSFPSSSSGREALPERREDDERRSPLFRASDPPEKVDSADEREKEELKKKAKERQAEKIHEEEERSRQQFARAQEKLRQLEQRARERERLEAEERKRRLQELRDPSRPSVWGEAEKSHVVNVPCGVAAPPPGVVGVIAAAKQAQANAPVQKAPAQVEQSPHVEEAPVTRRMPPPPVEMAPPPPPPKPPGPPPAPVQAFTATTRPPVPSESPSFDRPPLPRRSSPDDEASWEQLKPHPPSLVGASVWADKDDPHTNGSQGALNVSWPGLDKDAGPMSRKERKQAALANQALEPKVTRSVEPPPPPRRLGAGGAPVRSSGTYSLEAFAKAGMKKGKGARPWGKDSWMMET